MGGRDARPVDAIDASKKLGPGLDHLSRKDTKGEEQKSEAEAEESARWRVRK
jgi:hypothetical protein